MKRDLNFVSKKLVPMSQNVFPNLKDNVPDLEKGKFVNKKKLIV